MSLGSASVDWNDIKIYLEEKECLGMWSGKDWTGLGWFQWQDILKIIINLGIP
jgi:hypothetical protein